MSQITAQSFHSQTMHNIPKNYGTVITAKLAVGAATATAQTGESSNRSIEQARCIWGVIKRVKRIARRHRLRNGSSVKKII